MINILSYIKGALRIKILGTSPERFINLCSKNDILLWKIVQVYDVYYMNISLQNIYAIKPLLRKTGTKVIILKRYGLPFFMSALKKRKVFVISLILCIFFWIGTTQFIWKIEFQGNYRVTEDMLLKALEIQGIHEGSFKPKVDLLEANEAVREYFDDITWVGMGFDGTVLHVNVKEKKQEIAGEDIIIQNYEDKMMHSGEENQVAGNHIVSPVDGTIVSIIVRSGTPQVRKGDTVTRNQVLVEGPVPISNEDGTVREYINTIPDADILIEHIIEQQFTLPFTYVDKIYTGRVKEQKYLFFNEKRLQLPKGTPFVQWDEVSREKFVSLHLGNPVKLGYGTNLFREYQNVEFEYTLEQANEILNKELEQFMQSLSEKGVQIIKKNGKIDTDSNQWTLNVQLLVQEYTERHGE